MEIEPTFTQKNPETENEKPPLLTPPTASISLSLSSVLPTHFFTPSKTTHLFSFKNVKIPSQFISALSLSSSILSPPKPFSKKSSFSASPLQNPLSLNPRIPSDPTNVVVLRRAAIVWFRNDLRVHDNECLTTTNNESLSILPLYCFDPKDYGKSSTGFDKTGPFRASFLIESINDLRKSLKARGSDLVVRIGKPENVLVEKAKAIGADAMYLHREVSNAKAKSEGKIEATMKEEGVEVKYFWGSTLYHLEDLPFKLEEMPTTYDGFKEKVQGLKAIAIIAALDQLLELIKG